MGTVYSNLLKSCLKNIKKFTPPQLLALKKRILLNNRNLVVSSPTASGKTLIAEILFLKYISIGKKAVYVVPLRALAFEKYEEFRKKYPMIKVAVSVGDYDSDDPWLKNYDLIIVTAEKFDSLMRHKADWIKDVGIVVLDEFHMLGDPSRGATLEILTTKLLWVYKPRIVALSATLENSEEIANWLNADLVKSNWRPVVLRNLIYYNEKLINSIELEVKGDYKDPYRKLAYDTLSMGKQMIFFMTSRKRAESLAVKLAPIVRKFLTPGEKEILARISNEIKNVLEVPTQQCEKLAEVVKDGVAFHHAGLLNEQRIMIEKYFREGLIKVICSTTTLAMGLNLPAFRVFIDIRRRDGWISPVEYHQMAGRAGRPGFEKEGQAITLAYDENDVERIREIYHSGKLNRIKSSLFNESLFRMHLLSLISEKVFINYEGMEEFLSRTFYYYQNPEKTIFEEARKLIEDFKNWGFLEVEGEFFQATKLGKRVSELYIDPLSAKNMLELYRDNLSYDELLFVITSAEEFKPYPSFNIKELGSLNIFFESKIKNFSLPEPWELYEFYSRLKLVRILSDWINEKKERDIVEIYGIYPGDLRVYTNIAEWLAYSLGELLEVLKKDNKKVKMLREMLKHGVREELLDLIKVKYVGRVRARMLYNYGIRNREDIIKAGLEKMKAIFGEKLGEKIFLSAKGIEKEEKRRFTLKDYF